MPKTLKQIINTWGRCQAFILLLLWVGDGVKIGKIRDVVDFQRVLIIIERKGELLNGLIIFKKSLHRTN